MPPAVVSSDQSSDTNAEVALGFFLPTVVKDKIWQGADVDFLFYTFKENVATIDCASLAQVSCIFELPGPLWSKPYGVYIGEISFRPLF